MIFLLLPALAQDPPADPEPFQLDFLPVPAPAPAPAPAPVVPAPAPAPAPGVAPAPAPGVAPVAPVAPVVPRHSEDPVFVAPIQPSSPALEPEAQRLTQILRTHLDPRYRISGIDAVPGWPDYSAYIYMMACPPGNYNGCALVCGDRIDSTWTVGGTLTQTSTGTNVDLVFIGNESSRELIQFGVALNGQNDAALATSADTILRKIVDGAFDAVDLRLIEGDPLEAEKLQRAQNDVVAASLAELESAQGDVDRVVQKGERTKITNDQLAKIETGEQAKPWEALDMSRSEYKRYRNSGKTVTQWRTLRRGRLGQILLRVGLGGGVGPYGQQMDGRFAVEGPTLHHLEMYQFVAQAPHFMGDFELGFGVLPFLDVTAHYAIRQSRFEYTINQEQVGNPVVVDPTITRSKRSWSVGGRVAFTPFPVFPVRPSAHLGVLYWQGTTWQEIFGGIAVFQPFQKLSMVAIQPGLGAEISAGRYINIFARGLADIPIAGQRQETLVQGGNTLQQPAKIEDFKQSTVGFTAQVGVVVRLSLLGAAKEKRGGSQRFEEEEEGL